MALNQYRAANHLLHAATKQLVYRSALSASCMTGRGRGRKRDREAGLGL